MNADIFNALRDLGLPTCDFAIFGSGPLIVRGLIPFGNDLDIICRKSAWNKVEKLGNLVYLPEYDTHIVSVADGTLTFGTSWGIGKFDIEALIDDAETIDGLPFVRVEHVAHYKAIRGLPKDRRHIAALESAGLLA